MSGESKYVKNALYRATVGSEQGVLLWRADPGTSLPWLRVDRYSELGWLQESRITEATGPLRILGPDERVVEPGQVLLDLEGLKVSNLWSWANVVEGLRVQGPMTCAAIADQIEAQTKPPRIPEPGEFGSRVIAAHARTTQRRTWIRAFVNPAIGSQPWTDGDHLATWDDLIDPEVAS